MSESVEQLAEWMNEEGCGGCSGDFLNAMEDNRLDEARRIVANSIEHIQSFGYADAQATGTVAALYEWLEENQ